jgi:three-Cys-motif partner protein
MTSRKRSAPQPRETTHDEIGFWSEIKLDILTKYWPRYTNIIKKQPYPFSTLYIDAFAGSGKHVSKSTGEFIQGSPARALDVQPPFNEYHFIDLDAAKVQSLEELAAARPNVTVHHGDCNSILLNEVFPRARYKEFRRALCLLDPYSLQLDWSVIQRAGEMKSIEIFLNFPIMDMNRNVLRPDPSKKKVEDMTRFWGDASWRDVAFRRESTLFGPAEDVKVQNWELVQAFRERLQSTASFRYVPDPIAMRNTQRAAVYYLFFGGNNETGARIVKDVFQTAASKGTGDVR